LSIRLGVVVTQLEQLPLETIAEYLAALKQEDAPPDTTAQPVEQQLMAVFGGPAHRKIR